MTSQSGKIAYFSMEIGLHPEMSTYAGGLGMLAGDTIRAAADLQAPMVGVTLVHREGYFSQALDASGWQTESAAPWNLDDLVRDAGASVTVAIGGRRVAVRAWRFDVVGASGYVVPVYLLDTRLAENHPEDQGLTDRLYGGDQRYRLCQEVVLGVGGIRMLRALGYRQIARFHMNEGHSSLLALELMREQREQAVQPPTNADLVEAVRRQCVFTTHTPVAAGHDQFPLDLVRSVLGEAEAAQLAHSFCHEGRLNMTFLALKLSRYVNGVAKRHGQTSQHLFAGYRVDSITNGVHAPTWACAPVQKLFDAYIPGWRVDGHSLRYALSIPRAEIWDAHQDAKRALVDYVNASPAIATSVDTASTKRLDPDVLTLGFARRATSYKRLGLVFSDVERLGQIARSAGRLQLIFSGKAHPQDVEGKLLIQRVFQAANKLRGIVTVVYLPNYDMRLAQRLCAGVDVWLNTPQPPLEASGTSGMKAAVNGVPSLSVLDGWWIEGCIEGVTGWAIGHDGHVGGVVDMAADDSAEHAAMLYDRLEQTIAPMFYQQRNAFIDVMRHAMALNGSFFNAQRMVQQYAQKAYL